MRRRIIALGLLAVPTLAFAAGGAPLQRNSHGNLPARDIAGAVPWRALINTSPIDSQTGPVRAPARPSPEALALRDQDVRINGFMNPLDSTPGQRHFLLMAYPLTCPYCLSAGAQFFVEVSARQPIQFTYDEVLIEGRFVVSEHDRDGMLYRLLDARPARLRAPTGRADQE